MADFAEIDKIHLEKLFQELKLRKRKSWADIATDIGISKAMLFNYKNGDYSIYKEVFDKILKITKSKFPYNTISKQRFLKKEIKKPYLTEEFSEILGALAGDGHISNSSYEISITCSSKLDKEYIYHLKPIFERLFNLKFKVIIQDTRIRLKTYSKNLAFFLHKEYGLPLGSKKGKLKIPVKLKNNESFLKAYIRGLFDTDGSVYIRREKDLVIEIISADKNHLKEIKETLNFLGFYCGISGKNLHIYQKQMIRKFFMDIKPANSKHLKKYLNYSKKCAGGPMAKSFY